MDTKPKGTIFPKQQIEIKGYTEDKPYGQEGKTLDSLFGVNLSAEEGDRGKPNNYAIFRQELKDYLRTKPEGSRIICDIEERESRNPEYGPSRTIVQVYENGESVLKPKGFGGKSFGKSPETIKLEHELDMELEGVRRVSIERQTAANLAFEHWINENDETPWSLAKALNQAEAIFQWLHTGTLPGAQPTKTPAGIVKPPTSQPGGISKGNNTVADQDFEKLGRTPEEKKETDHRALLDAIKKNLRYNDDKTATTWLESVALIPASRAYNEPDKVLKELKEKYHWK